MSIASTANPFTNFNANEKMKRRDMGAMMDDANARMRMALRIRGVAGLSDVL